MKRGIRVFNWGIPLLLFCGLQTACANPEIRSGKQAQEPTVTEEEADLLREIADLSVKEVDKGVALLSVKITDASSAALDFALGMLKLKQDKPEEAEKAFRGALKKFPEFSRARANLGRVLIMQDEIAEALHEFRELLLDGETDPQTLTLIGYTFLLDGQAVPAEGAYRQAILIEPGDIDAYMGLAKSLLLQERYAVVVTCQCQPGAG
jgi:Flp pilus assembly protein TadD